MPRRTPHRELPELDCDMTPGDICAELQQLTFNGDQQFSAVKIDEQVRDYLVSALSARHISRRA